MIQRYVNQDVEIIGIAKIGKISVITARHENYNDGDFITSVCEMTKPEMVPPEPIFVSRPIKSLEIAIAAQRVAIDMVLKSMEHEEVVDHFNEGSGNKCLEGCDCIGD
jgi:hypothetical protein